MIVNEQHEQVESVGVKATGEFSISQTAKMFDILSSGLYTDKIKAVIRELSTNAWDSHIDAGQEKPFHVQLPTILEPVFTIRDYGTGLSDEDVQGLYTTYGQSTKTKSNDYVGALGLGSKSPFSYVKKFTVTSYFNGIKRVYACYSDGGFPKIDLLLEVETDEVNGMEISMPVNKEDINMFKEKAEAVYEYFNQRPTCNIELEYKDREPLLSGDGWSLLERAQKRYYYETTQAHVIMGNISYPIDYKVFDNQLAREFSQNNFIIHCEIGDVEMTANREALSMTEETIDFLVSKFEEINSTIAKTISDKIKNTTTKWAKFVEARKAITNLPDAISDRVSINIDGMPFKRNSLVIDVNLNNYQAVDFLIYQKSRKSGQMMEGERKFAPHDTMRFVIGDQRIGGVDVCKALKTDYTVYYLRKAVGSSDKEFLTQVKLLIEEFGSPETMNVSDHYVATPRAKGGKRAKPTPVVEYYDVTLRPYNASVETSYAQQIDTSLLDDDETFVFVETYKGRPLVGKETYISSYDLRELDLWLAEIAKNSGRDKKKLIGINQSNVNKAKKSGHFINIVDYIKENKHLISKRVDADAITSVMDSLNLGYRSNNLDAFLKYSKSKKSIIYKFAQYAKIERTIASVQFKETADRLGIKFSIRAVKLPEKFKGIKEQYPLFTSIGIGYSSSPDCCVQVDKYIELQDFYNKHHEVKSIKKEVANAS